MSEKASMARVGPVILLVLTATLSAVAQSAGPLNSQDLARDFMAAQSAGKWAQAVDIAKKWTGIKPNDAIAAYCLASAYARTGDTKSAVIWINKSVDNGFDRATFLSKDEDLASIRSDPGYLEAKKKAEAAQHKRFEIAAQAFPVFDVPSAYDGASSVPLLIVLHGAGGNVEDMARSWRTVATNIGAVLLLPRANHMVGDNAYRWGDIEETEYMINAMLVYARERVNVDPKRIILAGFSQGAFMAMSIGLRQPKDFSGIIAMSTAYVSSVLQDAPKGTTKWPKVHLMVGDKDRMLAMNRQAAKELKSAGVDVDLVVYPDLDHAFPKNSDEELTKAIKAILAGK